MQKKYFIILFIIALNCINSIAKEYQFLVGTYTKGTGSRGIYNITIDPDKNEFKIISTRTGIENPSFLAFSDDKKQVYAVSEDGANSQLSSFHFNGADLTPLNSVKIDGEGSCYIDECKGYIVAANYRTGNLVYSSLNIDKSISAELEYIQFTGTSINVERQEKSHLHQSIFSPDGKYLFTNNLGTDYTHIYKFSPGSTPALQAIDSIQAVVGGGPRHLAINTRNKIIYVLNELNGTIATISYKNEKMKLISTNSLIKSDKGVPGAADIHISTDGKFLYATNRENYNDISCFKILKDGNIQFVQQLITQGNWPRNFAISKDDKYIFIANQKSNDITVFKRDKKTGKINFTGFKIPLPSPVCLVEY